MTSLWLRPALAGAALGLGVCLVLAISASPAPGQVKEGQPAPAVDLPATQITKVLPDKKGAKTLNLKDLVGKKIVVLYFFPKAATKG